MPGYVWFAIGLLVGTFATVAVLGLCTAAKRGDELTGAAFWKQEAHEWKAKCEQMQWAIDRAGRGYPQPQETSRESQNP